ncbi:hypothetical protein CAB90_02685 [Mycobacterium tuberculosis]|nr:hypothetical protein CAB90_02685 [Mycobacterium tuberculosis]
MPQRAQALHQRVMITIVGSVDLGILTAEVSVRRVRGAEIDQGNRLLRIQTPIQHRHKCFHDELDDHGAARRTEHRVQRTAPRRRVIEHQRRCHRTARSLPRLDPVSHR